MKCLLNILSVYLEKDRKTINPQDRKTFLDIDRSDGGSSGSIEDVIIKVNYIISISFCEGIIIFFYGTIKYHELRQ